MKDEQFVEGMHTLMCGDDKYDCADKLIISTIIKRSFAHRDEAWRAKIKNEKWHYGDAADMHNESLGRIALFTDKETKE